MLRIREAERADRPFVRRLFDEALAPHYGGDHRAHADRVLDAHLGGGHDRHGHFSLLQRMFLLVEREGRSGLVHVVYKRQGTVKISPLIVAPGHRNGGGRGSALLRAAETFALGHTARQIYCTVAETNAPALRFFRGHGFVDAGSAVGQYKPDVREFMLYKPLIPASREAPERGPLRLREVEDRDWPTLRKLVLAAFAPHCEGVNDRWVQSLVDGHARRAGRDVNAKFKDVHVVADERDEVRGVAATGPKKGGSVKVMPLCAASDAAWRTLLRELPARVGGPGTRLYTHQAPDARSTAALQRHGWRLEGLLPGAYHTTQSMAQWGYLT
ncbi:GNAT family N-acetyltransferase [Streptomyces sp. PT12]|uniref:GNAT family N-acetyltransferase n=1 Tax=Streptomyces sp. PT12 TaxID=1510197 RepID=UPI000DE439C7|nr:GNAT family N-acetyltransferase [Streptomyces sp. PT12]